MEEEVKRRNLEKIGEEEKREKKLEKKEEIWRNLEKVEEASICLSRTKKLGEENLRSFLSNKKNRHARKGLLSIVLR